MNAVSTLPPLIGRHAEQARLARALEAARAGASDAVLLFAEAGLGKTALLRDAEARATGLQVLRVAGYAAEADLAYAGLWDLLGPVVERLGELPPAASTVLSAALALGEPTGPVDAVAVSGAVQALLALVAEDRPLLVVADDLQWLDDESRAALLLAARGLTDAGTAILLAARAGEGPELVAPGVDRVTVGGLADADARALVGERWSDLEPSVVDRLVRGTGGNPLALLEIPRSLTAEERAGTTVDSLPLALPLGRQLQEAFGAQLRRLPDEVGRAAVVAAALGGRSRGLLAGALQILDIPAAAIEAAVEAEVLVIDGDRIAFRHPLLAAAAYQGRPSHERRAAHAALAELTADPAGAAWHRAAATIGPDEAVAAALTQAGRLARARGAHGSAAAAFVRAAQLSTFDAARAERELEAARDQAVAGQTVAALGLVVRGLAHDPAPSTRSALVRLRAHIELRDGSPRTAEQLLEREAEALLAAGDPDGAATCLLECGLTHMVSGHMGALQAASRRAADLASPAAVELRLLAGLVEGEALLAMGRTDEGLARLSAAQPVIDGIDPVSDVADAVTMAAQALQWVDEFDHASRILARMISGARSAGAGGRLAYPLAVRAMLDWRRGRLAPCRAAADEALRLAELSRQATIETLACAMLARVAAAQGHDPEAVALADRGLAVAAGGGGDAVRLHVLAARGFVELSAGRPHAAAAILDEADEASRALAHGEPALMLFAADHVEALARCGRIEDSAAAAERLALAAGTTRAAWTKATAARSVVLWCPADAIAVHAAEARRWHAQLDMPLEAARTELAIGERRRRERQRGEARAPLQSALSAFDRLGADAWAQRARAELRATGIVPDCPGARPGLVDLSARELQVAELVAEGWTNREVAATLFMSARTVEHHLTSVYRKLDVSSRMQLARQLATTAP